MQKGKVKWFNVTKGYGFITPETDNNGRDIFVHISTLENCGLKSLNEGQSVEFETGDNRGKIAVVNLKIAA